MAGLGGTARPLSTDHKPMDVKERERIEAAGGFVEFNRVNGNLALSRALGDFVFKMNDQLPQVWTDIDLNSWINKQHDFRVTRSSRVFLTLCTT